MNVGRIRLKISIWITQPARTIQENGEKDQRDSVA